MTVGLATTAVAMGTLAAAAAQRSLPVFIAGLGLSGLGGIVNAAAQIGTAVGIAVLLVVASGSGRPLTAYLLAAALATAALVVTVSHRRDRRRSR
jgi:hypothetical protein